MDTQAYIQSGVIESYVLGLLSSEETDELLRLAYEHPEIQQAIDSAEIAFERNAIANAINPDNAVKTSILSTLQLDFTEGGGDTTSNDDLPALAGAGNSSKSAPKVNYSSDGSAGKDHNTGGAQAPVVKASIWKAMAAAAIILLVISASINFYLYNHYRASHDKYLALLAERNTLQASLDVSQARYTQMNESLGLMGNPAVAQIKMAGVAGKESSLATVYWDSRTREVYLLQNHLPQAPAGKQYQLWAIVDGKPVDAGIVDNATCAGLCKMKTITTAQAFAITLEKQGGSPAPSNDMYVLGKV